MRKSVLLLTFVLIIINNTYTFQVSGSEENGYFEKVNEADIDKNIDENGDVRSSINEKHIIIESSNEVEINFAYDEEAYFSREPISSEYKQRILFGIQWNQYSFAEFAYEFNFKVFEVELLGSYVYVDENETVFKGKVSPAAYKVFQLLILSGGNDTLKNGDIIEVKTFGAKYPEDVREKLGIQLFSVFRSSVPKFPDSSKKYLISLQQEDLKGFQNSEIVELHNELQVIPIDSSVLENSKTFNYLDDNDKETIMKEWDISIELLKYNMELGE